MVLLDILSRKDNLQLVVAHFNHGIRPDSADDERLVADTAKKYGLGIEIGRVKLGLRASEEKARRARYDWLRAIMEKHSAKAIITAHHQDDLLETAMINILRGTGRRGLSAISDNPEVIRPLLTVTKRQLIRYAKLQKLNWREDVTNQDDSHLRNYIRNRFLDNLPSAKRIELLKNIEKVAKINKTVNELIATISHNISVNGKINRQQFAQLPVEIAGELIIHWLRKSDFTGYDKKMVNRLMLAIKTGRAGTRHKVSGALELIISQREAFFERRL